MEHIVSDIGCWTEHAPLARQSYFFVGFVVLTAVIMKSAIFWDITPCSPLKVNRRFRGTCRLHLQGRNRAVLAICFHAGFLLGLFFGSEDKSDTFLRNFEFERSTRRYIPAYSTLQCYFLILFRNCIERAVGSLNQPQSSPFWYQEFIGVILNLCLSLFLD
jgi:hypothetical protein